MLRSRHCVRVLWCALAVLATSLTRTAVAQTEVDGPLCRPALQSTHWSETSVVKAESVGGPLWQLATADEAATWSFSQSSAAAPSAEEALPLALAPDSPNSVVENEVSGIFDVPRADIAILDQQVLESWSWQWLPVGLIYHSYLAGVHEPRMALVAFNESSGRALWDATLGGRVGMLRFGDGDPVHPQGYQLDFYGAAVARLDVEHQQDLDSTDYVFGLPITYGVDCWQFKFGYAHVSSHLGDELALREPSTLAERVNYVRDSFVYGVSYYANPLWRQYAEVGWAFHNSGGAQPWEAQVGTELSLPGPTGMSATPYVAVNGRMREEHDFGGDVAVQVGWLRRGLLGQTLRLGVHYYNGKSSQFQFFDKSEEQIGVGLWYDM